MLTIKYMILTIIMIMTIITLITLMSKKSIIDMQKSSPFECGFNPMSKKRLPFSIHFFLVAIIFLIFDVEIVIIMPMVMSMKFTTMKFWSLTCITFLFILLLGLYYEWSNGLLNWTK
uniref:NADH-ubiquinone oxidoreductase chain 3 n=2 Tax=Tricentrus TaxID=104884 RepID=A0A343KJ76_9HEMI|nr:NADH dehydrogenase subunit 3 [Tricentrus brunneus]ATG83181.1 NADH dehydrogenase subunit 3 [Tricentrus sp. EMHAU-15062504]QEG98476.1 NADH dehydrogenase subunit 3 [Tricentrus brunneus]